MSSVRFLALPLSLLLLSTSVAAAQAVSATTGAINGRVTDNTGAILPGVTVTLASPSMMGTRTAITNDEGQYRFPADSPWRLSADLRALRIRHASSVTKSASRSDSRPRSTSSWASPRCRRASRSPASHRSSTRSRPASPRTSTPSSWRTCRARATCGPFSANRQASR